MNCIIYLCFIQNTLLLDTCQFKELNDVRVQSTIDSIFQNFYSSNIYVFLPNCDFARSLGTKHHDFNLLVFSQFYKSKFLKKTHIKNLKSTNFKQPKYFDMNKMSHKSLIEEKFKSKYRDSILFSDSLRKSDFRNKIEFSLQESKSYDSIMNRQKIFIGDLKPIISLVGIFRNSRIVYVVYCSNFLRNFLVPMVNIFEYGIIVCSSSGKFLAHYNASIFQKSIHSDVEFLLNRAFHSTSYEIK